jgi:DNA-binding protein Fis
LLTIVMRETRNNQSEAARMLGISRGTLRSLLKKFGML